MKKFRTWKTIILGVHTYDIYRLLGEITCRGFKIYESVFREINRMRKFPLKENETNLKLVKVTPSKLGFQTTTQTTYENICNAAKSYGLKLCPLEAALQLRWQYKDQKKDEYLIIATEPILIHQSGFTTFATIEIPWRQTLNGLFVIDNEAPSKIQTSYDTYDNGGLWLSMIAPVEESTFSIENNFIFCL